MIHHIAPHTFNPHYTAKSTIAENDFILQFRDRNVLLDSREGDFKLPRKKDVNGISSDTEFIYLFSLDNTACFLIQDIPEAKNEHLAFEDLNFFRSCKNREMAWISLVGFHLSNWYAQNRYCGRCGTRLKHKDDERALICPDCTDLVFPSISPAIIVAIVCRDRILLARNTNFRGNWFALIAGFVDVGESLEEALIREVKEEVGLDVWNIRYYTSQPWPLSGSMMVGFVAEADDKQALCVDGKEIAEAAWFSRGALPEYPSTLSISGEMIEKFEKGEL